MVVQRNNVNNTRKQQSLLCFLSLIRHSMALEKSPKKNGLSNAVSGTSGVFLLRRNSYRYRQIFRHRRLFFPILFGVLVVVVLFLFLSLPISDDDHRHRVLYPIFLF